MMSYTTTYMVSSLTPEAAHSRPIQERVETGFFPESGLRNYEGILRFIITVSIRGDNDTAAKLTDLVYNLLLALDTGDSLKSTQIKTQLQISMENYVPPKEQALTPPPEIAQID